MKIHHALLTWLESHHLWDRWSGTHAIRGAVVAWLSLLPGCTPWQAFFNSLIVAVGWEIWQCVRSGYEDYGSVKNWFLNSLSDVVYESGMGLLVATGALLAIMGGI